MLGSFEGDLRLSLSYLLELDNFDERRTLDARLFNEIFQHNLDFKEK